MKNHLFIAHWYPNEINTHKGIFIENHARCINTIANLTVVDFSIQYSKNIYSKKVYRGKDNEGVDVLHIHIASRFYKSIYYSLIFQSMILKKSLKKEGINVNDYDSIISNVIFPSGIIGWKLAKEYNKQLFHIDHWSHLKKFLLTDFHKRKALKALKYSTKISVVSELLKKDLVDFISEEKIEIIPNVVKPIFHYSTKNFDNEDKIKFLAVANWRSPKNPFLFVEALEELAIKNSGKQIELTIIGEGEQLDVLKKRNGKLNITYAGVIPNDEMLRFYQESNFFLLGSDYETFSIVSIEALMTGTPVIGNNVGVLAEVINPMNGILCDQTLESWIEGIEKAINTKFVHSSIAAAVKNRYSPENIAMKFKKMLNDGI